MHCSLSRAVLYAASLVLVASPVLAQTTTDLGLKPIQTLSCYKDVSPLAEAASYQYASDGWCQQQCGGKNKPVMAMIGGSTCYCGDIIPSLDKVVPDTNCNSPCNGFGDKFCGGTSSWRVYLTGLSINTQTAANGTDSADASSTTSATPSVVTKVGQTVVVTASAVSNSSVGPNKVGIAVGIVVALIIIASLLGAAVFFLRQRRKRAVEEEYKRNAAIAEFTNAKKSEVSSMTDQRLDATFLSSNRRESIGSIADEMDFTRRILQVRNPDHRASSASGFA